MTATYESRPRVELLDESLLQSMPITFENPRLRYAGVKYWEPWVKTRTKNNVAHFIVNYHL
jgi:hypothetical protein